MMILVMVYVYLCSVSAKAYLALVALAHAGAHESHLCVEQQGLELVASYLVSCCRQT